MSTICAVLVIRTDLAFVTELSGVIDPAVVTEQVAHARERAGTSLT